MGITRGYAFAWKEEGFSREEVRPALRRVLADLALGRQKEHEAQKAMVRAFALEAGVPDELLWEPFLLPGTPAAWACYRPGAPWLAVNDNVTECGAREPELLLEAADRYARAFGAPALVCGVYDSGFSTWAYAHPGMRLRVCRLGGWPLEYFSDCPRERRQLPEFLCPFLTSEGVAQLEELWMKRFSREEERLEGLAALLGTRLYDRDREAPPAGTELICVQMDKNERTGQRPDEER